MDTALKTAHSGYLTRKLVDLAGNTNLLSGAALAPRIVASANARLGADTRKAQAATLLRGVSQLAGHRDRFFPAATFHKPAKGLTQTGLAGQATRLRGVNECVLAGRRVPLGKGKPALK